VENKNNSIKIKFCGLKREKDIELVNMHKPDFIGFVFAKSPREIDFYRAETLKKQLDSDIIAVGVFVNENISFIERLVKKNIIDFVQLHGDEDENYIKQLKNKVNDNVKIIKSIEVEKEEDTQGWGDSIVDYLLLDNGKGTGKSFDWNLIKDVKKPFFIAGGINSENMEKLAKFKPFAIDLSSGIESDGVKDSEKIKSVISKLEDMNKLTE
jgi:phosphoribosylanthranilate isomerase